MENKLNIELPPLDISDITKASDIMEKSPFILGELETAIGKIEVEIGRKKGQLTIDNKDEKQAIIKAIVETDEEIVDAGNMLAELRGSHETWKDAWQAAKQFHKSQTNS